VQGAPGDFRTFRLDRMEGFAMTDERFRAVPGRTLHDFLKRADTWTRGGQRGGAPACPRARAGGG